MGDDLLKLKNGQTKISVAFPAVRPSVSRKSALEREGWLHMPVADFTPRNASFQIDNLFYQIDNLICQLYNFIFQ